jgi:hypothetical protein
MMTARTLTRAPIVIDHVTVIDGTDAPPRPETAVVVEGDTIEAMGPSAELARPSNAQVVEATGKYMIPGLWDMHLHTFLAQDMVDTMFPVLVAHGVVGVRDTHGDFEIATSARREVSTGRRVGPRSMAPHLLLDGSPPIQPTGQVVATPEEARAAVRARKEMGVDYVKVYSRLSREAYLAIADECRRLGILFAGHVPFSVTAAEASEAGQYAFEHLMGVEMAVSSEEDALRHRQAENVPEFEPPDADVIRLTFDRRKADELYELLARNQTWQCPTLVVHRGYAAFAETDYRADPRWVSLGKSTRQIWDLVATMTGHPMLSRMKPLVPVYGELTGELWRAGVPIVAGSDTPNPLVFPGSSLHEELELLVGAGLTPLAALQAATREAARFRHQLDSQGTVEAGKVADLVLLDANPLEDIRNTRKIAGVVLAGRYLDRAALDGLLEESAAAAAREPEGDGQEPHA